MNKVLPTYISNVEFDVSDEQIASQFQGENINNSKVVLKQIDLSKADVESVKRGSGTNGSTDIYSISEKTKRIYYLKGFEVGNKTYYTLTDDLAKLIGISKVN
ncbi:hypothetical protein D3C76_1191380 [compost metagenome]